MPRSYGRGGGEMRFRVKRWIVISATLLMVVFACMCARSLSARLFEDYVLDVYDDTRDFRSVSYSPDGQYVVVDMDALHLSIYDVQAGEEVLQISENGPHGQPSYSPDGNHILSTTQYGSWIQVSDALTGAAELTMEQDPSVAHASYSPDGERIVSSHTDGIRIWDAKTGQQLIRINISQQRIARYNPDGLRIISSGIDGIVHVWDAQTGNKLFSFTAHNDKVWDVFYTPDGTGIITYTLFSTPDNSIRLWDANTGNIVDIFQDRRIRAIHGVAMSSDGGYVAALGRTGFLVVWNANTGRVVKFSRLLSESIDGRASSVEFSPDGTQIAVTGYHQVQIIEADYMTIGAKN
jgi:WD40 repeat protein